MRYLALSFVAACGLYAGSFSTVQAQEVRAPNAKLVERLPVKCTEDSPERRGEEGCTILVRQPLTSSSSKPLYWHLDRFDSLDAAQNAAGRDGVAAEAFGSVWLMTVEAETGDHHGGNHVSTIGPFSIQSGETFVMRVMSSRLLPGSTTPIHTHSGPEAFYIVGGQQCLETTERGNKLSVGQTFLIPTGVVHRGRVIGSEPRRALAIVLHVQSEPASHDLSDPPALAACK